MKTLKSLILSAAFLSACGGSEVSQPDAAPITIIDAAPTLTLGQVCSQLATAFCTYAGKCGLLEVPVQECENDFVLGCCTSSDTCREVTRLRQPEMDTCTRDIRIAACSEEYPQPVSCQLM